MRARSGAQAGGDQAREGHCPGKCATLRPCPGDSGLGDGVGPRTDPGMSTRVAWGGRGLGLRPLPRAQKARRPRRRGQSAARIPARLPEAAEPRPSRAPRYWRPRGVPGLHPVGSRGPLRCCGGRGGRGLRRIPSVGFGRSLRPRLPAAVRLIGACATVCGGDATKRGAGAGDEGKQSHVGKGASCVCATTFTGFQKESPPWPRVRDMTPATLHGDSAPFLTPLAVPGVPPWLPAASTCPKMARTRCSGLLPRPSPSRPEPLKCSLHGLSTVSAYTPYIVRAGSSGLLGPGEGGGAGP